MRGGHLEVGVTKTPQNPQVIIGGRTARKAHVWDLASDIGGGVLVQKIVAADNASAQ